MEITESKTSDIVTINIAGKMDPTSAKTFEETILNRIESGDRRFVIDLSQLDYIGSAGLRVFACLCLHTSVSMARTASWCCAGLRKRFPTTP
jgi:anti-anti-sigma factor